MINYATLKIVLGILAVFLMFNGKDGWGWLIFLILFLPNDTSTEG